MSIIDSLHPLCLGRPFFGPLFIVSLCWLLHTLYDEGCPEFLKSLGATFLLPKYHLNSIWASWNAVSHCKLVDNLGYWLVMHSNSFFSTLGACGHHLDFLMHSPCHHLYFAIWYWSIERLGKWWICDLWLQGLINLSPSLVFLEATTQIGWNDSVLLGALVTKS